MDRVDAMKRYARQMAVPELGFFGQESLRAAHLLVVGAGGLAAPLLQYLVGAGVGRIRLVDPDRVERSNLHRQTLYRETTIGRPKVEAAAESLQGLNPETRVEPRQARLDAGTAAAMAMGVDLVIDCADSFAVSYVLSDLCRDTARPFISASVSGLEGYAGGFCGGAPSLRAVFPEPPQRFGSCAEDGVLGPVVGVLGSLQAQMVVATLAGIRPSPLGSIVSYDARTHRTGGFRFDGAQEPERGPAFIPADMIRERDFVVDLRSEDEGPLVRPYAHRHPAEAFGPSGPRPAPGQRAVLCCRSGLRAWTAAVRLASVWPGEISLVALGVSDDH